MTANNLTETLDSLSDKAFGFKDKSPEQKAEVHETVSAADDEDKTQAVDTSHAPTATYPVTEEPTAEFQPEKFDPESDPASQQGQHLHETESRKVAGSSAVKPESYPEPPANPPSSHQHTQGLSKNELKNGPEQDFTVATVAGFMGVLCLFLMLTNASLGVLAVVFGATAVYFARRTERAGTGAGIGKTLGWFSFFGGIVAILAAAFFLFVAFVVLMVR
jgi:hypothetical protein